MFVGGMPGGSTASSNLIVKDCTECGRPTVFATEPETAAVCAGCAGQPAVPREKERRCPADGTLLVQARPSNVVVDECPECRGIWLDAGELDVIIQATRSAASSQPLSKGMELLVSILGDRRTVKGQGKP